MIILASEGSFRPLTAYMTSEIKNNYAYNILQDICNKFMEVKFFVGCMVSPPNPLLHHCIEHPWIIIEIMRSKKILSNKDVELSWE